jgi:hypothetical protein
MFNFEIDYPQLIAVLPEGFGFFQLVTSHIQSIDHGWKEYLKERTRKALEKRRLMDDKFREINGYFQTYRYFDSLENKARRTFELKQRSKWYMETFDRLSGIDFIAVHIRRGDLKNFSVEVGLLDSSYYFRAISEIENVIGVQLPIVVFSDEISLAKKLLSEFSKRDVDFLIPAEGSSPAESLLLMSQSTGIVIANSTFSWWGAMLGKRKTVIAPSMWFKNMNTPRDLYPGDWIKVQSSWED